MSLPPSTRANADELLQALIRCAAFINDNWQAFGYQTKPQTLVEAEAVIKKAKEAL